MPSDARPRRQPTNDWSQLRFLIASPEQETYELLRPIVLFGQSPAERARETRTPERTLRRNAARFDALGMRSLFDADVLEPPARSHRALPAELERAMVELKAEHPAFGLREIARVCRERFGRPVSHHTVGAVLAREAPQSQPPRRFRRYHEIADPVERRRAVATLYLDGWSAKAIAGYLETSRRTVDDTLRRWDEEGWPGLADRPFGPRPAARKVDLKAMAAIRRLQANPELGEFRIHAALQQLGIRLSPRTCGRILAFHRALGAPKPSGAVLHEPKPMPFAAERRHEFWSVDIRYVEDHSLETEKPVYVISVLENFSRALLASAISPRQDLTAYLIVLRAAVETHGAPEVLVSDSGSVFKAKHAQAIYRTLGIRKVEIERRQPWQNDLEPHFNIMRRMADHEYAKATTWTELRTAHERFFRDDHEQSHFAHLERADGRLSPAAVLGWVQGKWCAPVDLDRLFRIRSTRVLTAAGSLRFRHWRLYGERGLAGEQAAVWVHGDALTIEHAAEILAQYHIVLEADGHRLRDVGEARLYVTGHAPPQLFLPLIAELPWRPAQRLASYQPRQTSAASETQAPLFDEPRDALARQTPGGR